MDSLMSPVVGTTTASCQGCSNGSVLPDFTSALGDILQSRTKFPVAFSFFFFSFLCLVELRVCFFLLFCFLRARNMFSPICRQIKYRKPSFALTRLSVQGQNLVLIFKMTFRINCHSAVPNDLQGSFNYQLLSENIYNTLTYICASLPFIVGGVCQLQVCYKFG